VTWSRLLADLCGVGRMGERSGEEIDRFMSRTSLTMIKGSEWL
jgi:hypothetical protein